MVALGAALYTNQVDLLMFGKENEPYVVIA